MIVNQGRTLRQGDLVRLQSHPQWMRVIGFEGPVKHKRVVLDPQTGHDRLMVPVEAIAEMSSGMNSGASPSSMNEDDVDMDGDAEVTVVTSGRRRTVSWHHPVRADGPRVLTTVLVDAQQQQQQQRCRSACATPQGDVDAYFQRSNAASVSVVTPSIVITAAESVEEPPLQHVEPESMEAAVALLGIGQHL